MIIIPKRQIWTRQPQYIWPISREIPKPHAVWVPGLGDITGRYDTLREADTTESFGRAYQIPASPYSRKTLIANSSVLPTSGGYSVLVLTRQTGTQNNGAFNVGVVGGGSTDRCALSTSGPDALVLDYGGYVDGSTRVISTGINNTEGILSCYLATTGPLGMRLFANGSLLASNSANPSRGATTSAVAVGDIYDGTATAHNVGAVAIWFEQLPDGLAAELSANPWEIIAPQRRHVFVGASGSPTAYTLPADSGTFALTGTDATLARGRALPADSGTFALTGTDATLARGRALPADSGTFALTGTAATLTRGRVVAADSGTFALTGTVATLTRGRVVAADSGTFALTGTDATLEYTPVSGDTYTLPCASGSFALTGTDAVLAAGRVLVADSASFALTGTAAVLAVGHVLTADAGSIALTGTDATLLTGRVLPADAGVFALTGTDVTLAYAAPPSGEVTLSAQTISDIADAVYARFLLGAVPVNIVQVNSTPVDGTGTQADPWGPV